MAVNCHFTFVWWNRTKLRISTTITHVTHLTRPSSSSNHENCRFFIRSFCIDNEMHLSVWTTSDCIIRFVACDYVIYFINSITHRPLICLFPSSSHVINNRCAVVNGFFVCIERKWLFMKIHKIEEIIVINSKIVHKLRYDTSTARTC